ncbi:hypothetical protein KQP62_21280, partial [Phocaeicola dorei]|uniref:hypothetical protein n=1 Tax=Phocaeicola dorei TaxID=357276 RepID=UPI00221FF97E
LYPSRVCGIGQSVRLLHTVRYCLQSAKQIGQSEILQPFPPVSLDLCSLPIVLLNLMQPFLLYY